MSRSRLKYAELADWLKRQMEDGALKPGGKLYSENELTAMTGLSRQTVRRAIALLEEEGLLEGRRGSGTYILDRRKAQLDNRTRISVVTTYVDDYIFPKTIQGIEKVLFENGYSVQIAFTNNLNSREETILEDILGRDEVAGVIMETTKSGIPNPNLHLYGELSKKGIPVLFINSYYPQLSTPHISLNDKMAGRKVTDYLIGMGHRRIGGIFKLDDGQGHLRYAGYLEALQSAGIEFEDRHIVWIDTEIMRRLRNYGSLLLDRLNGCSAVFCYNDQVAFDLMEIYKKEGIRVPEDVSLTGIDDSELAVLGETALTSVPHPMNRLGEKAAQTLLGMIRNPFMEGTYEFDAELICRSSVLNIK